MDIVEAKDYSDNLLTALQRLLPQMSPSAAIPGERELSEIISAPNTVLLIACEPDTDGDIIGTLTITYMPKPSGLRAWIDDVIVDEPRRGSGVGTALMQAALSDAKTRGVHLVNLTSRESRAAASRLYRRAGFTQAETNIYKYSLEPV
ncbi:MAG: GNAT family N-acetyltransferase [Deltaproteobacteria bacterium]|nr:GNAT family N-acetyltransferase [Deltaproteobacteria bacterium]